MLLLRLLFVLHFFTTVALAASGERSNLRRARISQNFHRRARKRFFLRVRYEGDDFLDPLQWSFFINPDPTNGMVNYQSMQNATSKKLAVVTNGSITLAVDDFSTVPPGGNRDSIRISSTRTFSRGLFIADFIAMPYGCSLWPAYWSVGPDWPSAGEMDIVEGVHEGPHNQYVLHSSPHCQIQSSFERTEVISNPSKYNCSSSPDSNTGCTFSDPDTRFYGKEFNAGGGGVFAHLWDKSGVKIWRFARDKIPDGITKGNPDPTKWGIPAALFPNSEMCDFAAHFFKHSLVLDITICGGYGGDTYSKANCTETCAATCAKAVENPANYKFAKWKINYIAVYDR